jgi:predicted phosphodiesterase
MHNTTVHLGDITQPLLLFGGCYSNLQATEAIRAAAAFHNIPPEQCICTGDIVAYCAQTAETVSLMRNWGVHCLMGNCEESFANDADDCGCGFDTGTQCDMLSAQWFAYANQQLNTDQRQWFSRLPREIHFSFYGQHVVVIHGSVSSINQFIFNSHNDHIFQTEFTRSQADIIIGGHCGIPFTKAIDDKVWHNAGAIGMPANDGTARTWYSIIDIHKGKPRITIHALHYDYAQAAIHMQHAGMNNGYADALLTGLWPSMDILPNTEKSMRGIALQF